MARYVFGMELRNIRHHPPHLVLLSTILLLMMVYAAAAPFLIRAYGPSIRLFCIVFIAPAALFWGVRGGLAIGLLTVVLNLVLHGVHDIPFEGGWIGPLVMGVAVVIMGRLSDLSRQHREKIHALRVAEDALRASETKYRYLFEMESDAVFLIDMENSLVLEANTAAQELFGFTYEELVHMHCTQLCNEPDRAAAMLKGGEQTIASIYMKKKDGSHFPAEVSAGYYSYRGRRVAIIALRDITWRKTAEEEKRGLEKRLQQAQRMEAIGTLAGGIAHDFNNILSAICGYGELMRIKGAPLDIARQDYLTRILGAAERARELVVQILTFSRQTASQKRPIKICPVAQEVISLLRASIPSTIAIKFRCDAENDAVIADTTQIYQVIMNLCTNAAQAMGDRTGKIEIAVANVSLDEVFAALHPEIEPGAYLKLTVADTGCGMDAVVLRRVFEPYFTTKEKSNGTGLGLSVVHGIVLNHNGCVLVESTPGKGTVFSLFFPSAAASGFALRQQAEHLPRGTERILVVDDEAVLSELLSEMLKTLGYSVAQRVSSQEALSLFKAKPYAFDLVITDMSMPQMSGAQFRKEIFRINRRVPVLICTGFSDAMDEATASRLGFHKLLMKPVSFRDLAKAVRNALDAREKADA